MPKWIEAGLWGLLSGSALVIGAVIGFRLKVPRKLVAMIMAFGSGVLISALSFELMEEAFEHGGIVGTSIGFVAGALIFTFANMILARQGAKHRKRSGEHQPTEAEDEGSGAAIALGALLDGIPESIVIGLSLVAGGVVSWVAVMAVFMSNLPEGLASASGMKRAERTFGYVMGLWGSIALVSGIAAIVGFLAFRNASADVIAGTTAVAAGAILAMIADTMIPEAFEQAHDLAGLVTVAGFLAAFTLSKCLK
jgi:ZIP family zinc transporter